MVCRHASIPDSHQVRAGAVQGCPSRAWPCESAHAGLDRTQWATWRTAFGTACLKLTLVVLLLASSLQGSLAWPFRHPPPPELIGLETTWQCSELKPWQHPNRTVCEFRNVMIFNGDLWVFSNTTQPLPSISRDFWLTNVILDVRQIRNPADIFYFSPELPAVTRFKSAVAQWWVFHQNYFHIMAEVSLPNRLEQHAARATCSSCQFLGRCLVHWRAFEHEANTTLPSMLQHSDLLARLQHLSPSRLCLLLSSRGWVWQLESILKRWVVWLGKQTRLQSKGALWHNSHSLVLCALLCPLVSSVHLPMSKCLLCDAVPARLHILLSPTCTSLRRSFLLRAATCPFQRPLSCPASKVQCTPQA